MINACDIDMLKSSTYMQMWLNVEIICDDAKDNEKWKMKMLSNGLLSNLLFVFDRASPNRILGLQQEGSYKK